MLNDRESVTLISPQARWMHAEIPYPPLAISYLSAMSKQIGINPAVVDYQFSGAPGKLAEVMNHKGPQLVGISATLMQLPESILLAQKIKAANPDCMVVLGGAGPNCLSTEEFFAQTGNAVDLVCQGEGELTWVDLLQRFIGSTNRDKELSKPAYLFEGVPGIVVSANGEIQQHDPRPQIQDLDSLPLPDLDAIDARR